MKSNFKVSCRLCFLLIFFAAIRLSGQVKFEGIVKDSIENPLEMASIVLVDTASNTMVTYGITAADGKFSLKVNPNKVYKLQISAFGLRTLNDFVSIQDKDFYKSYLLSNSIVLDEVVVKLPVSVSGDTIVYNADSFKNGTERKLEDIIKNLPGVEINANNQIEVEGKVVNKLLVNGKEFFEGDTKLGTKNIPSNVVDKIQVLRNYSEVGQLNSVRSNQDNFAINIKLKEGKENFLFGNVTAGAGRSTSEQLYLAQPKIFYYNPDYSINFIGDLNNLGEIALTRRDLQGLVGRFQRTDNRSGTNIDLGDNSINFNTNQNNAQRIENKLATANFSYSPNPNLDFSGFIIYNYSLLQAQENRFIRYTDPQLNIPDESTVAKSNEESKQGLLKFSTNYKPNVNNQLEYDLFARFSNDLQNLNTVSSVLGNTEEIESIKPFSINQNLNYYLTLSEKNILSFELTHVLRNEDPFYNAIIENEPSGIFTETANVLGFTSAVAAYNVGQNRKIFSNQADGKVDFYHILNSKANLNFTAGVIRSHQEFNANIFQILDDNSIANPDPENAQFETSNTTIYNFLDLYAGAHLRFRSGKFTVTPGLSIHQYIYSNNQSQEVFENQQVQLLPDFETRIQLKKSESLTFNYRVVNQFTDITRLARSLVMNTYNSFQFGEPELQNGLSHNLSLLYSSFNLFNNTNVFARASYTKNTDQIRSVTNFENIIRTSTFFNSGFADESANMFGRIQKTVGKVRFSTNANLNYSALNQLIQGSQSLNKAFTRTIVPGFNTNFRFAPNLTLSYRNSVTENNQGSRTTTFVRNSFDAAFDALIQKQFTFKIDYSYTEQDSNQQDKINFQALNSSLLYRKDKDSKWEYELRGTNLLNIDAQIQNSANNLSVFSSETFIQPRFISLRFIYSL